jgi:beta-alanine--pyruvate transaminase
MNDLSAPAALDYQPYWMPFTANRKFKDAPRLLVKAEGMYYWTSQGQKILDGTAGLWCVNAGHGRKPIAEAVARQLAEMDYAPSFQMGHPVAFEFAAALTAAAPAGYDYAFFTNSGSESVDSALKIALAYHRARGEAGRVRFVGRERAYHGVGFGGFSVGGIAKHRAAFGNMLTQVSHLPATYDRGEQAYSRHQPEWGAHLADELQRIVNVQDASTIAAVIVEPVAGSTGVLPPPKGYLDRLRKLCDQHGILLIFDEVITGFGRLGTMFAAERYGVMPDLITCAKGLTNGTIPMGAVLARAPVYDAVMKGSASGPELSHGYTYSGHPVACAAGLATLRIYAEEGLFQRSREMAPYFEQAVHSLRGRPRVVDIRNAGLLAAIELEAVPGEPGKLAQAAHAACFERGVMVRAVGDTVVLSPPLVIERSQVDEIVGTLGEVLAGF